MWLNISLTSQIWAGASLSSWCNPCGVRGALTFLTLLVWGLTPVPFSWFGAYSSYYEWWRRKKERVTFPRIRAGAGSEEEARQLWLFGPIAQQVGLWRWSGLWAGQRSGWKSWWFNSPAAKTIFFLSFWHIWSHLRGAPPRWGVSGMSYLVETPWANSGRPGEIYVCPLLWECFGVIRDRDHLHVKTVFACRLIIN